MIVKFLHSVNIVAYLDRTKHPRKEFRQYQQGQEIECVRVISGEKINEKCLLCSIFLNDDGDYLDNVPSNTWVFC